MIYIFIYVPLRVWDERSFGLPFYHDDFPFVPLVVPSLLASVYPEMSVHLMKLYFFSITNYESIVVKISRMGWRDECARIQNTMPSGLMVRFLTCWPTA